jgi:hypothetical protein
MSDDDLWRPQEAAPRQPPSAEDHSDPGGPSSGQQADEETQPLHGASAPPPGPPGPPVPPGPPTASPSPGASGAPPPQNPYGQPSPYGPPPPQNPFGQNQYGQNHYGQNHYGQNHYGQDPYGQPYTPPPNPYQPPHEYASPQSPYGAPYQPAYAGGLLPDHPSTTTALVLGIIGLAGLLFCGGITLVLSPVAWLVGAKAVREIDSSPGRYGGRDRAQAGRIMGIIGTVLLVLAILAIVAIIALVVASGPHTQQPPSDNGFLNG